jgi:hypothetical protein
MSRHNYDGSITIRRNTKKFHAILAAGKNCQERSNGTDYVWADGVLSWAVKMMNDCSGKLYQIATDKYEIRLDSGAANWRFDSIEN